MPSKVEVTCRKVSQKVGAWANVTKVIMGICFLLLFILGLAMAIVCGVSLAGVDVLGNLSIRGFTALMYMGLFLGLFLAILSLLGALGYFTLNRALLIIVTCLLLILAILQITCGSLAFAYDDKYEDFFKEAWSLADDGSRAYIEETYHCCGGMNASDRPASKNCTAFLNSSSSSYTSGAHLDAVSSSSQEGGPCIPKLVDDAKDKIVPVGVGVIVVTVLELAVVIVTIILVVKIGRVHSYYQVHDEEDDLDVLKS